MKSRLESDRRSGVVAGLVTRKTEGDLSRRAGDSRGDAAPRLGCHVRRVAETPETKPMIQTQLEPNDSLD
jgi:hypothetical protein